MEPLDNFHWGLMSVGAMRLYHYLVLQPISFATSVNLNSTMCPAISDPFNGPLYRLAANLHQTFFIIIHGKIYCLIGNKFFVPKSVNNQEDEEEKHSKSNGKCLISQQDLNKFIDANGNDINNSKMNTFRACDSCESSPTPKFEDKLGHNESKYNQIKED